MLLLMISGFMTYGQNNNYVLKGYLRGIKTGTVKLVYNDNIKGINIDGSARIDNGQFIIKGKLAYNFPYLTYLWLNDSLVTKLFFISSGYQVTHLDVNHFLTVPKLHTKASKENEQYNTLIRPIDSLINVFFIRRSKLYTRYNNDLPDKIVDSLKVTLNHISDLKDQALKSFLAENPKSYVGLWYLFDRILLMGYRSGLYDAYNEVDVSLKQSIIGEKINTILTNSKKIQKSEVFPSFRVQTISGDSILFNVNKENKITLVDFWYSHCAPCIAQFDELKKLYRIYHPLGFVIVGISIDDSNQFALWHSTIHKYELPWTQYIDAGQRQSLKYGINSFPYNFVVNDDGIILDSRLDMPKLEFFLKKYFEN